MPSTSRLVSQTLTLNLAVLQQSLKLAEKACWQFLSYNKICLCVNFPPNQDFLQTKSPPDNQIAWWRNVGFTWVEKQHTKVKSLCIQILFIEVYISNLSTKKTSPPAPPNNHEKWRYYPTVTCHAWGRWPWNWPSISHGKWFQAGKHTLRGGCDLCWRERWEEKENQITGTIFRFIKSNSLTSFGIAMHKKKRFISSKVLPFGHKQNKYVTAWMVMQQGTQGEKNVSVWGRARSPLTGTHLHSISHGPLKGLLKNKTSCKVLTVDKPISQIILNWWGGKSHVRRSCSQKCCF